jgi:hypothetical protein
VVDGIPIETVMNDLSSMPRHKVVISESPASTTNRLITRSLSAELLRVFPQDAFGTRQVFTSAMVKSLDTFDAKDQEKLEKFRELEEKNAELMLEGNLLKMQLGNTQMKMQLVDMEKKLAAQKQMAAAPVPGMSATGAPPAPSPEPIGGPVAGSEPAPETGAVGSLEGGPVSPEKSAGFQSGGAVTGAAPAAAPIEATPAPGPDGTVPAPAAPGPMPQQQPPKLSDQEIVDQVAQETGGKVSISFTSKPKPQG